MFFVKTSIKLKSNKGSSLVMVLLITFLLATLSTSFILLTISNLKMSMLSADLRKASFIAESGVEKIAAVLDNITFVIQENAKEEAVLTVCSLLENDKALMEGGFLTSEGEIDYSRINKEFNRIYSEKFVLKVYDAFGDINSKRGILFGLGETNTSLIMPLEGENGIANLISARLSGDSSEVLLNVLVKGSYKGYSSKTFNVTFNLMPESSHEHYAPVPKIKIKKINLPEILKKAVLLEKDLIVADGTLNITGDVLAFGTIPTDPLNPQKEDLLAEWNGYGGIVAGIPFAEDIDYDVFTADIIRRTGTGKTGHIFIDGSAATMSYIHSMYGEDENDFSTIGITSDSFARSIRSEQNAFYSKMHFDNDVYVMDNLQIDSDNSVVTVNGKYFGFVTAGYDIDGTVNPETYETYEYKHSSSIVVNGNSYLNLNGSNSAGIYIGGTSFLETYRNVSNGNPYMLGLSASTSSWNLIQAFKETSEFLRFGYGTEADGVSTVDEDFQDYISSTGVINKLLDKKDGALLNKKDRGFHIKGYWQNIWNSDPHYPLDTNRIIIKTDDSDSNKIYGFLNGTLVANSTVFHPFEVYRNNSNEPMSEAEFIDIQRSAKIKYFNKIQSLLNVFYNESDPYFDAMNIKLDYVTNTKSLSDYVDSSFEYIYKIIDGRVLYYKKGDIEIDYDTDSMNWTIDGQPIPNSGIIYAGGNIYIRNGFNFKGSVLAQGSLVCYGDSTTSTKIEYDEYTIKKLLYDSLDARLLFKIYKYGSIDENPVETQRILTNNISIKEWKVE